MAIKKQDLSIDTNFEQFCENWIDPIECSLFKNLNSATIIAIQPKNRQ